MVQFSDAKEIILALKNVYKEKKLSIDKVLSLVNSELGEGVLSRSTIQAVFAPGSEDGSRQFGYDTVLKPLCIVLLDIEQIEEDDPNDVRAYKSILRLKKDIIEELRAANEQTKVDYAEKLQDETEKFQRSMEFMKHQIDLKDQRIDELLAGWREMSSTNKELTQTNNRLVQQLMDCPLKKKECNED